MAFVNALAWVANGQDHHPDFSAGYHYCEVKFTTHAVDGLSENDFICAARTNALLD
jgi:4a-hydroxytetrahydrobiopterin dehydratase